MVQPPNFTLNFENKRPYSEQHFCEDKCLVHVRGQRSETADWLQTTGRQLELKLALVQPKSCSKSVCKHIEHLHPTATLLGSLYEEDVPK